VARGTDTTAIESSSVLSAIAPLTKGCLYVVEAPPVFACQVEIASVCVAGLGLAVEERHGHLVQGAPATDLWTTASA
jgi:hypothetical protein